MASERQGSNDEVEELVQFIAPYVESIVKRISVDRFTTVELIDAMQLDDETRAAYDETVRRWHESNPELAKMVVHGQVIPQALRRDANVVWDGYAHGEPDAHAVPAWWLRVSRD